MMASWLQLYFSCHRDDFSSSPLKISFGRILLYCFISVQAKLDSVLLPFVLKTELLLHNVNQVLFVFRLLLNISPCRYDKILT